ncbi:protein-disulfide reductase DsbD domain-containing protein [Chelativorans salis]|uniref:Protein-disulfide reductase DsbD family protein n=1 Tax=Chelativorans salis TaxID=2978478 RepID=A0ABT2LGY8_9HYPH|nr:protein-disulfide reductase DsbD domain-containing protein [Chelativorans sp. EGI FJ00035]MCT7373562.1 protein-disulfide reductase DsbD family protein [Chelativorans sp. EGI FJ00035]
MLYTLTIPAFALALAVPAAASSSQWFESDGGAVRLVTSGLADEEGRLRGALEIRLEPGWKTYWRDPGEAGVPPQIELSTSSDLRHAEILFPPPKRITDAYATWAGYPQSVALPVVFQPATPGTAGIIEGSVFLGICETICIPFQASFSFDAGADPDNAADGLVVTAAFAALPDDAGPGFQITGIARQEGRLLIDADLPENAGEPVLFLAAPEGVRLGTPALEERQNGSATFSAEILDAPDEAVELPYTLVLGGKAVSGTVLIP